MNSKKTSKAKDHFSKMFQFLKRSYLPILRAKNILIVCWGISIVFMGINSYYDKLAADERILELKTQISQAIRSWPDAPICEDFSNIDECIQHTYDKNLEIQELSSVPESSLKVSFIHGTSLFLFLIVCILIFIPIIRILRFFMKKFYSKSGQIKEDFSKMTAYQKYTVIILIVILIILLLMVVR